MGTSLETGTGSGGTPVLKRSRIGEAVVAGLVDVETRPRQDIDGNPILKDNGKPRYELILHLLVKEGDMNASIGGVAEVPEPGDTVRLIEHGGGFAQWIDAKNTFTADNGRGIEVGDLIRVNSTHVVRYQNRTEAGTLNTQDDVDAYFADPTKRGEQLSWRGELMLKPADNAEFSQECEVARVARQESTPLEEEPFPASPAPAAASGSGFDW